MEEDKKVEETPEVEETHVSEPIVDETADTQSEEPVETEDDMEAAKQMRAVNQLGWKIFDEFIANSDIPFEFIVELPTQINACMKITQGRSKEWDKIQKANSDFGKTCIKDWELYEDVEEDKAEN